MFRWIRIAAIGVVLAAFIAVGAAVALILVANARWVVVAIPPWLGWLVSAPAYEVWLPALIGGWVAAVIAVAGLLVWSLYYVYRRRQYESLIAKLERELTGLRNLPLTRPAPLEDLPEEGDGAVAAAPPARDGAEA
ncbi:MAG: hypothetical protein D6689_15750 [Deltaproteobacteria bacterium]|nr:MAG: hypothetical protein D6689_15750 [Deltaproteobacteria bacterium]